MNFKIQNLVNKSERRKNMAKNDKMVKSARRLIILTILTTVIVTFFSLSKYESSIAGTAEARIALMANSTKTYLTDIKGMPRENFYI